MLQMVPPLHFDVDADADPGPACHFDADPDPAQAFHIDAYPDQLPKMVRIHAGPDPISQHWYVRIQICNTVFFFL